MYSVLKDRGVLLVSRSLAAAPHSSYRRREGPTQQQGDTDLITAHQHSIRLPAIDVDLTTTP
jgi:hypothetical protein